SCSQNPPLLFFKSLGKRRAATEGRPYSYAQYRRKISMRKVTFGGANSLDNFFARKDDSVDLLLYCKEVQQIMKDYWKNIDTVVMGRRTYEVAIKMGGDGGSGQGVKTYIFSRTIKKRSSKKLTFVSDDAADYVRRLKQEKGKDI